MRKTTLIRSKSRSLERQGLNRGVHQLSWKGKILRVAPDLFQFYNIICSRIEELFHHQTIFNKQNFY